MFRKSSTFNAFAVAHFSVLFTLVLVPCTVLGNEGTGTMNAVVIGIRAYDPDQLVSLPNAESEATDLFGLLERAGYNGENSALMTNSSGNTQPELVPTKTNLLKRLESVATKLQAEDTVVFAFTGHGVQGQDGKLYLCPLDADLDETSTLIPMETVYELIGRCKAEHKLIVLDANRTSPFAESFAKTSVAGWKYQLPDLPSPPSHTAVFVACSVGESTAAVENGVVDSDGLRDSFFKIIAKGLRGEATGGDGAITLPDLERYTKKQFADRPTANAVHPFLQNNTAGLFPLFVNSLAKDGMDTIQDLIREDRYQEAMVIVENRLTSHPNDAIALAQKSRLISYEAEQRRTLGRMKEATECAEAAVKLAPNEALPYVARANTYRIAKQYEKAFADASTAVQCDPNNVMAHVIRAFAYHHLHDLEGMGREAKLGMEIDPNNPESRGTYVGYLFAKGRIDEGLKELDRAIAISPRMAGLYFLKGYGMDKKGRYKEAAQQYGLAIQINDQVPGYYCRRAVSHANSGNATEAMADIASAEKIMPTYDDIAAARSMVIQKQKGYGKSGSAIAEGLKANPKSADLWQGQGFDFYNRGKYAEAIESFNKALEINPGYAIAHMGIGMACVKLNKLDDAMVHLNRATRHEERLARAYYEKAELYALQGNQAAALAELDKAIQYEPNDTVYALRRQVLVRVSR